MSFDQFAQRASEQVTRPWFFWLIVLLIGAWLPTLILWDTGPSDLLVDSLTNPISLILLVLLQNSQSRLEKAQDSRQDHVERSLALLLRHIAKNEQDSDYRKSLDGAADDLLRNAEESTGVASAGVPPRG